MPQGAASEDVELNLDWEDVTIIAIVVADPMMFHGHPERKRMSLRGCLKSPANAKFTERGTGFMPALRKLK